MSTILGAGLSGLICGALNASSHIYERNPKSFVSHRAVLRFRDDKIFRALGLPYRKVTVRKAISMDGQMAPASPRLANYYSMKVRNVLADSSIWNLSPSERVIAPEDLHEILADLCGKRVAWDFTVTPKFLKELKRPTISTIPLPLLLDLLGIGPLPTLQFQYAPINVARFRVQDCDVFQTIYFPSPNSYIYRATLTGSLLTIESIDAIGDGDAREVCSAFGLYHDWLTPIDAKHRQAFGKITPVLDGPRKALLHRLTLDHGIYSLGRFATWRNILLDDVYDDIFAIRKMQTLNQYDVNLERTKQ